MSLVRSLIRHLSQLDPGLVRVVPEKNKNSINKGPRRGNTFVCVYQLAD